MQIYIYKLVDPVTNEVRYIGKTGNLKNRFSGHLSNAKKLKSRLANWISSLARQNLQPIIEIVEICSETNWENREIYWINYFKTDKLCNVHPGGQLSFKDNISKKSAKKYDLYKGKYRVRCSYLNTVYHIGEYKTETEAITAYNQFYKDPYQWIIDNPRLRNNQNHNKTVYVYTMDYKLLTFFESVAKCAKHYNIDPSSISQCCKGRLKTYKKMIFKYEPIKEELV